MNAFDHRRRWSTATVPAVLLLVFLIALRCNASMFPLEQQPNAIYNDRLSVRDAIRQLNTTLYSSCASVDEPCGNVRYTICAPMPREMFNGTLSWQESARDVPMQAAASYGHQTYEVDVQEPYTVELQGSASSYGGHGGGGYGHGGGGGYGHTKHSYGHSTHKTVHGGHKDLGTTHESYHEKPHVYDTYHHDSKSKTYNHYKTIHTYSHQKHIVNKHLYKVNRSGYDPFSHVNAHVTNTHRYHYIHNVHRHDNYHTTRVHHPHYQKEIVTHYHKKHIPYHLTIYTDSKKHHYDHKTYPTKGVDYKSVHHHPEYEHPHYSSKYGGHKHYGGYSEHGGYGGGDHGGYGGGYSNPVPSVIRSDAALQLSASAPAASVYKTSTDFQLMCMCAATFVPSEDQRRCVCPSGTTLNKINGLCEARYLTTSSSSAQLQAAPQPQKKALYYKERTPTITKVRMPSTLQTPSQYNVTASFGPEPIIKPFALLDPIPKQRNDDSQYFYQNQ